MFFYIIKRLLLAGATLFAILFAALFVIVSCDKEEINNDGITESVYETENATVTEGEASSETQKIPNKYDKYDTQASTSETETETETEKKQSSGVGDIFDWSEGTHIAG
jgi:ABC-type microcin C transport system permease subunit YejB